MISKKKICGIIAVAAVVGFGAYEYFFGDWGLAPGTYAEFKTNEGTFVCKLMPEVAPHTVDNFIGLAEGTKEFRDMRDNQIVKRRFYDGLIFHRVINGFMIQGGCPLGTGTGHPGYVFKDEFSDKVSFDKPGLLAMANSGPNSNGCQFFVTLGTPTHLNRKHTIFGEVVRGMDVVQKIGKAETMQDKPIHAEIIETVRIIRR